MRPPPGYEILRLAPKCQLALPLSIAHQCGQAFRWRKVYIPATPGHPARLEWSLALRDRIVFLCEDRAAHRLFHRSEYLPGRDRGVATEAWLRDYLHTDAQTDAWYADWCEKDPVFAKHAQRSNNNIPRISQMVHKLCTHFSPLVHIEMYPPGSKQCLTLDKSEMHTVSDEKCALDYHPFPSPTQLEAPGVEMQLRALGFGYRAKYLARTAEMLCERARTALPMDAKPAEVDQGVYAYLYGLRNMSYYEARKQLLQLQGVGPKVADCVLLMSLDQHDSIPVDRHVFQFAERWYSIRSKRYEEVADRLRQVLFYADLRSFASYGQESAIKEEDPLDTAKERPALASPKEESEPAATQVKTESHDTASLWSPRGKKRARTQSVAAAP